MMKIILVDLDINNANITIKDCTHAVDFFVRFFKSQNFIIFFITYEIPFVLDFYILKIFVFLDFDILRICL